MSLFTRIVDGVLASAATFNAPLIELETAIVTLQAQMAALISVGSTTPVILTHPAAQSKSTGQTCTFTVVASGGTLTYVWQKLESGGSTWATIPGATSSTYTTGVLDAGPDNGDSYRVVVTNSYGSTTSNAAVLTVGSPAALAAKFVAYYDFTADGNDDTGKGRHLDTGTAPAYGGTGATFTEDDYLIDAGTVGTQLSCTIVGWFDAVALPASATYLFEAGGFILTNVGGIQIQLNSIGTLTAFLYQGDDAQYISASATGFTVAQGNCFFALVHDAGAKTLTWHKKTDAGLVKGSAVSYAFTPVADSRIQWGSTEDVFSGILRSCGIANEALSDANITTLYNAGTPLAFTAL